MKYLRLSWRLLRINVLREMAYRAHFFGQSLQAVFSLISGLLGLAVVDIHGTLNGWNAGELLALLGIYQLVGGIISMAIQPGMRQFMGEIRLGTLDFTLLKPVDAQFLVSTRRLEVWKISDVLLGSGVLIIALINLGVTLDWIRLLAFVLMLGAGSLLIYCFWLMLATCAFWLVRVDNILVIFQDLYVAGRWPVTIYPGWLRWPLTFLVPVTVATTIPTQALLGQLHWQSLLLVLLLTPCGLLVARWFWRHGLRHYSGASA
ncbi:MAG TPA: ABC-2 family transporter protein [Ktedonobacteraceae bacterium]|nr:ABC-2 family transporter protein [Ktedonobacteraceae bacterium]